jgi:hypothetical protein
LTAELTEPGLGTRTWRPSAGERSSLSLTALAAAGLGGLVLWGVLSIGTGGHGKTAGWLDLAVLVTAFGWLAGRVWTLSATLTEDALLVRNVLTTKRVPLADISMLSFQRGVLRASTSRVVGQQTFPGPCVPVRGIRLGGAYWTGRRCDADRAADLIADAAGLSLLPPRKVRISRRWAVIMLPGSVTLIAAAAVLFQVSVHTHPQTNWVFLAPLLWSSGWAMIRPALAARLDYFSPRNRRG